MSEIRDMLRKLLAKGEAEISVQPDGSVEVEADIDGGCIELTVDATPEIKAAGKTLIAALRGIK
jgi:hypothetical protein